MKIVLTGGTGLIGNALGQALVKQGHELHVLARSVKTVHARLSYPCTVWPWKEDQVAPTEVMQGADIVIHLAGENVADKRWTKERKRDLRESRVRSAKALADSVVSPLRAFISASGIGYFGDRGNEILNEGSSVGHDFLAQLCQEWEQSARQVRADRHVQLRFGVVLSGLGGFLKTVVPLFRLAGASRLSSGKQYFSWIHIDDAVAVVLKAVHDSQMDGPYNVVSAHPVTNTELTETLADTIKAFRGPPAPKIALQLLYGELTQALLGSQRARPERLLESGFEFKYPDLKAAVVAIFPNMQAGEMNSVYELWVPSEPAAVWEFFSSERNLERITPPFLRFKVDKISTPSLQSGTLIDYSLKIRGVPAHWRTLIGEWHPPNRFSDEQLKGPYAKWHHVHEFEKLGNGVLLRDTVRWRLPMGLFGRLAALNMVLNDVDRIFSYRAEVIGQIFSPH